MKSQSIAVLEKYISHWHQLRDTGSFNIPYNVKEEIHQVWMEELKPPYRENLWCGNCVSNLMRTIYGHYERTVPNAIIKSVIQSQTFYPNGEDKSIKPTRKPRKSKNDKGRIVSQAGEQHTSIPEVSVTPSDSTPG